MKTFSGPSLGPALPLEVLADDPNISTELDLEVAMLSNLEVTTSGVVKTDVGSPGLCTSDVRRSGGVKIFLQMVAVVIGLLSVVGLIVVGGDVRVVGGLALVVSTEAGSGRVH